MNRDLDLERATRADAARTAGGRYSAVPGAPTVVGQVYANPTVPATTGTYFSFHPVSVLGSEAEGAAGTLTVDTSSSFLAYVFGSQAPVAGEFLACRFVGSRWVAERLKPPAAVAACGSVPGLPCIGMPTTLHMLASHPELNGNNIQSSLLVCGPAPSVASGVTIQTTSGNCYRSPTSVTGTAGTFTYVLQDPSNSLGWYGLCLLGSAGSWLVPGGGTSTTPIYWYRWQIGFPGNTCIPFVLAHGQMYVGGNAGTVTSVTG